ncbi:MAG: hypothetical protein ABIJ45_03905 [Candidatus Zixiibacteriota bacterium]
MKPSRITMGLGAVLVAIGVYMFVISVSIGAVIPVIIGGNLIYLAISKSRVATLVFGHSCIAVGIYMVTWGILLLPYSEPRIAHIFARPLFWGLFSMMGGICAIFHGFCRCVTKQVDNFEHK